MRGPLARSGARSGFPPTRDGREASAAGAHAFGDPSCERAMVG